MNRVKLLITSSKEGEWGILSILSSMSGTKNLSGPANQLKVYQLISSGIQWVFYNHETFRAKLRAYREPSLVTLLFDLSLFACEVKSCSVLINVFNRFALSMSLFWFKSYLAWDIGPLIPRDYSLKIIMSNKLALKRYWVRLGYVYTEWKYIYWICILCNLFKFST